MTTKKRPMTTQGHHTTIKRHSTTIKTVSCSNIRQVVGFKCLCLRGPLSHNHPTTVYIFWRTCSGVSIQESVSPSVCGFAAAWSPIFLFPSTCLHLWFLVSLQISVDRGMPWDEALNRSLKLSGPDDGFYLSLKVSPCYNKQTEPEDYYKRHYISIWIQTSQISMWWLNGCPLKTLLVP